MSKNRGFTLLELVIAMGIFIGVAFFIVVLSRRVFDTTLEFSSSLTTQQQIQQTLQVMVPEIRSMAQSNTGGYPVEEASTSTLIFYSDIDFDGVFERIRYSLSDGVFIRGVVEPTGNPLVYSTSTEVTRELVYNIIEGVDVFSYYSSGVTSTEELPLIHPVDIQLIRMIRVDLIANQGSITNPSIVGGQEQVTIRNLRYIDN
ncbi:MAG: hypothetical protein COU06_00910 [Candidatus Harrisonbacteria bacterium CG10_big_fil_rev_8_21_14_0_10_38_8]|uniref:Type II secretion system protein J n=1 Tax=Candidatus Harrisonbacteria bacterium CG10_big_fil_rev_8_21_14_0_10_38_8 TaxID=1974582 RepID=A0A2M6WKE8_9BACT|nr:MAG: hypothetical protein COU06_00910 [Candidatus Harrisonbacteria bacterium CG10_big_fil_rev_8_21_14_0_10_38_8]